MSRPSRTKALATSALVSLMLLVSACTASDPPEPEQPPETDVPEQGAGEPPRGPATDHDEGDQAPDAEPVSATETFWDGDDELELTVDVGPVVRQDDLALLPLSFEVREGPEGAQVRLYSLMDSRGGTGDNADARLIDSQGLTVSQPVLTEGGEPVVAFAERNYVEAGQGAMSWFGLFDAPDGESTSVMLTYFGFIEDVPVLDDTLAEVPGAEDVRIPGSVVSQTFDVEQYRERIDVQVSTETTGDQAITTIAADLLFEPDQHELTDAADAALQAAAGELNDIEGGELQIVGHTDDVHGAVDNQELSENRANAVHERLQGMTDLSVFDEVATAGLAYDEPVAPNDSDAGRALNRRVELRYTAPAEPPRSATGATLPQTAGPISEGGEPLEVTDPLNRYGTAHVHVESVHRSSNLLVGRISVEQVGDEGNAQGPGWPLQSGYTRGIQEGQGGVRSHGNTDAPTLLVGHHRVFAATYLTSDDGEDPWREPLTDRRFGYQHLQGDGRGGSVTVIWPDVTGESVTIDVPDETEELIGIHTGNLHPFRFLDVPVD